MSLPNQITSLLASTTASYTVGQSLRFRASASAYLNRTPPSSGNRTTWTFSTWCKRGTIGTANNYMLSAYDFGSKAFYIGFVNNIIDVHQYDSGSNVINFTSTPVYRDPAGWYHLVVACDTTQATSTNRMKIYINGVQVTAFSSAVYGSQNYSTTINQNTGHLLCAGYNGATPTWNFDGYMAETYLIDGQQLTPSSFGVYDGNGVWQPAKYTGTYGTCGFYLPYSNKTSTTTIVQDASGNSNNWTPNNISLTSGTTYDSMLDSPTNAAGTSYGVGSYCTLNPLNNGGTLSAGNLNATGSGYSGTAGTIGMSSGKWYWEVIGCDNQVGLGSAAWVASGGLGGSTSWGYITNGNKITNGVQSGYASTYGTGDLMGIAFDADAGTLTFYKNNVSQGVAFTGLTSGPYFAGIGYANPSGTFSINFGQRPFTYTPPSGHKALNTYNLPTPTITNGAQYMAATLYTGNGSTQSIVNSQSNGGNNSLGKTFYSDFVWAKRRSGSVQSNNLADSVRGVQKMLYSDLTNVEATDVNAVTAFNSNGFSTGSSGGTNNNGDTYVAWQWNAGSGSTSTNTSGSITSTVSVNAQSGTSVVTYTGNGVTSASVGHGLGATPNLIFLKRRDTTAQDWGVWNTAGGLKLLVLNNSNAYWNSGTNYFYSLPSSTVFYPDNTPLTDHYQNVSGANYVAYCFSAVSGFSAFGSISGSSSNVFTYLGFRPRLVIIKRTDSTGNWNMWDSSRNTYNVVNLYLNADQNSSEGTFAQLDFLSNGINFPSGTLSAGASYIYMAWAENPFKISRAR